MPQYNKEYKVRYILKLYKDGSISDLKLVQGNASSEILESSQKAISKSAPFAGIDIGDNEVITDIFAIEIVNKLHEKNIYLSNISVNIRNLCREM